MKTKQLREMAIEELALKEKDLKRELFDLNYQRKATGRVEKPGRFRTIRRDIARILTLLKERENGGTNSKTK